MAKKTTRPRKMTASQANIRKAIAELELDQPYYLVRVVGNRLEFSLYGGQVVYWPPKKGD